MNSRYIGYMVGLVLCYGLVINILEGPWKAKVRELYPNSIDYIKFMGQFNIWMGISCVTFMMISSFLLRKLSWLKSALLTPMIIFFTGIVFFLFIIFAHDIHLIGHNFNPIYIAVIAGASQNILSKSTKYSLFDVTKEIAYIPLSLELRTKGKASVEVIGIKLGKSLGAFIQSSVFMIIPSASFDSMALYLMIIFIVVIAFWLWDIIKLNGEYLKIQD
jgi:ATP/ADP translocase